MNKPTEVLERMRWDTNLIEDSFKVKAVDMEEILGYISYLEEDNKELLTELHLIENEGYC